MVNYTKGVTAVKSLRLTVSSRCVTLIANTDVIR